MLEKNERLEYLEVIGPIEHEDYAEKFSEYHLRPVKRSLPQFRLRMMGFLSVISCFAGQVRRKKRKGTA